MTRKRQALVVWGRASSPVHAERSSAARGHVGTAAPGCPAERRLRVLWRFAKNSKGGQALNNRTAPVISRGWKLVLDAVCETP